jgi:adenosylhomocysteinase
MSTKAVPSFAFDVKDLTLAEAGRRRMEAAFQSMPVLQTIRKSFIRTQPLSAFRISACLPLTPEAGNLLIALRDGGAELAVCAGRAPATQDDVAASLVRDYSIPAFAQQAATAEQRHAFIANTLQHSPHLVIDCGSHLIRALHSRFPELAGDVVGAIEESSGSATRLRAAAKEGELRFPIISMPEARTRQLFDHAHGTGQGTVEAVLQATRMLLAGSTVVVAGYGRCGRGVAHKMRAMGAQVIVTEVEPSAALQAAIEGMRVMGMQDAAALGDVFITVTGNKTVIGREVIHKLKNGAVLCNAGSSPLEIDREALAKMASSRRSVRDTLCELIMPDGRRLYLMNDGLPIECASGSAGSRPAAVHDLIFAYQALSIEYLVKHQGSLAAGVCPVPEAIDRQIARMTLDTMSLRIDRLTPEQEQFLACGSDAT